LKSKTQPLPGLSGLTLDDLEDWAGETILSRGDKYQRQDRVKDLAITEDNGLIAWVQGSKRYATKVIMDEDGRLTANCACLCDFVCKHAVAVVIDYLDKIGRNKTLPRVDDDDERIDLLTPDIWEENISGKTKAAEAAAEIIDALKSKTKNQLVELLSDIIRSHSDIAKEFAEQKLLQEGKVPDLVKQIRREIRKIGEGTNYRDNWDYEIYIPDLSKIRRKLEALLKAGYPDDVLKLAKEIINKGDELIEYINDEGETGIELGSCSPIIVKALEQSSLDEVSKLNWALDIVLNDHYGIYEEIAGYFHSPHPEATWNMLADQLAKRLNKMSRPKQNDYSWNYRRNDLSSWLAHALEMAGRKAEVIPLYEKEALITNSYARLVDYLINAKRYEEAEEWITKGVTATQENQPGTAHHLRTKLLEIRKSKRDWQSAAELIVVDFVENSSVEKFKECQKICEKIKLWMEVRESLLNYLQNGELPWNRKDWALPYCGFEKNAVKKQDDFPKHYDLIDIAIYEKQPEQVLYWYEQVLKKYRGYQDHYFHDRVAEAVKNYNPERAVEIWKTASEGLIAQTKPKCYEEAARYLRKIKILLFQQKKEDYWKRYLAQLKFQNARKRSCIAVLDDLEKRAI